MPGLSQRFPPRLPEDDWPATRQRRGHLLARLFTPPFTARPDDMQSSRRIGLTKLVHWLEAQPGRTWQERWVASGADAAGNLGWRELTGSWLRDTGWATDNPRTDFIALGRGLLPLICGDVIRPSLGWLLTPATPKNLAAEMARSRDPGGFAALAALARTDPASAATKDLAARRIAVILAAKGGTIADVTAGDCLELLDVLADGSGSSTSPYFYQLLHALGTFPAAAPPTVRAFKTPGQLTAEQLVDRYPIACQPVRALIIDYLRERQLAVDHATLRSLSRALAGLFWRDLELHHPGIGSLRLEPGAAAAWKQRVTVKTARATGPDGQVTQTLVPRHDGMNTLAMVRAFYLDIAQWAVDDPARWGPWAVPCPIRDEEMSRKKERAHRKSRMDQRTRERLPVLPVLAASVDTARRQAATILLAAQSAPPGGMFTAAGQTLSRPVMTRHGTSARIWAEDPATGKRRDLTLEEHRAFWAWAAVEVLRLTGIRIEELAELSHHSFVQYRLPATGELIPLLQVAPSKTDTERLLVIAPELADVLSAIISRIRGDNGAVPLVVAYDIHERVWNPPMPLLFQRQIGIEHRPIPIHGIRALLNTALARTGLTDASGNPLTFTPHDFRRLFITEAVMNGMPPHIAQLLAGHADIRATMGYKAVYPEEVINAHRAFIARRRATRPSEEYRLPTDEEWDEFLGHFERRKVALGDCGRAYGSSCSHEHSCERCPLLRVDPAQRARLESIRDNLTARIGEAEREGWTGEAEGLKISLDAAGQKLAQLDQRARRAATVHLGMPGPADTAGRVLTAPSRPSPPAEPS
ncbi:MAG: tyrosine-type recombinase/integrase [Streptosporangiaceae bacterium]